jgi:signal transduction histidine kinase
MTASLHDVNGAAAIRLLLIEDSPSDAMLIEAQLRDSMFTTAAIEHESSLAAGLARLGAGGFDGVLVDLGLPDSEGLDTFVRVAEAAGAAAVVVVTGLADARLAEEAVCLGAQDYLIKSGSRPGEFGRAVDYAIRRQRVIDELARARDEQLATKDRFLSHVSHELRSPLSVVHQFASLLYDGVAGPLSVDQREFLGVLIRNVGQLKVMIDDLLEVGLAQRGRLAVECHALDLRGLLADAVAAYVPAADHRDIALRLDAGLLPAVVADGERIREVLANVIDNALKFTAPGGTVTLEGTVDGVDGEGYVRVTTRDTGCGVRAEDLGHIFEQFFQAEQSDEVSRHGLGLGLFVCKDLIERQGGAMWAESTHGQGTAVSFTVPTDPTNPDSEATS